MSRFFKKCLLKFDLKKENFRKFDAKLRFAKSFVAILKGSTD